LVQFPLLSRHIRPDGPPRFRSSPSTLPERCRAGEPGSSRSHRFRERRFGFNLAEFRLTASVAPGCATDTAAALARIRFARRRAPL
jgi:hypothetical protein